MVGARTKRLFVLAALVVGLLFAGTARAAYDVVYWQDFLWPQTGANSNWDVHNNRWFCNRHSRDSAGWGLVTFIDSTGYNWHFTSETFGTYTESCMNTQQSMFQKLCHCKNTDGFPYFSTCIGRRNGF